MTTNPPRRAFGVSFSGDPLKDSPLESSAAIQGGLRLSIADIERLAGGLRLLMRGFPAELMAEAIDVLRVAHMFLGLDTPDQVQAPAEILAILDDILKTWEAGPNATTTTTMQAPSLGVRTYKEGRA